MKHKDNPTTQAQKIEAFIKKAKRPTRLDPEITAGLENLEPVITKIRREVQAGKLAGIDTTQLEARLEKAVNTRTSLLKGFK